jgi:hypothetical protein
MTGMTMTMGCDAFTATLYFALRFKFFLLVAAYITI